MRQRDRASPHPPAPAPRSPHRRPVRAVRQPERGWLPLHLAPVRPSQAHAARRRQASGARCSRATRPARLSAHRVRTRSRACRIARKRATREAHGIVQVTAVRNEPSRQLHRPMPHLGRIRRRCELRPNRRLLGRSLGTPLDGLRQCRSTWPRVRNGSCPLRGRQCHDLGRGTLPDVAVSFGKAFHPECGILNQRPKEREPAARKDNSFSGCLGAASRLIRVLPDDKREWDRAKGPLTVLERRHAGREGHQIGAIRSSTSIGRGPAKARNSGARSSDAGGPPPLPSSASMKPGFTPTTATSASAGSFASSRARAIASRRPPSSSTSPCSFPC